MVELSTGSRFKRLDAEATACIPRERLTDAWFAYDVRSAATTAVIHVAEDTAFGSLLPVNAYSQRQFDRSVTRRHERVEVRRDQAADEPRERLRPIVRQHYKSQHHPSLRGGYPVAWYLRAWRDRGSGNNVADAIGGAIRPGRGHLTSPRRLVSLALEQR